MNDDRSEIDLIEYFLLIKEKFISIIISMVLASFFAVLFLLINKNEVTVNYSIKIKKESPSMLVNCSNRNSDYFSCRENFIESIIEKSSDKFKVNPDERSESIILTWSGDAMKMSEVDDAFKKVIHGINSWYISDYQSYKASIVKNDNAKNTEMYAKMAFLVSQEPIENDFISISSELKKKYSRSLIAIFLMIGFALSFSYHLLKKIICRY